MKPSAAFLDTLELAANRSAQAESDIRREWAERIKTLERERAFAHRRFNFMRAIAEAVATAESEEIAVASATAAMRAKLGWWDESDARTAVLARFVPVAQQIFAGLAPVVQEEAPPPDILGAGARRSRHRHEQVARPANSDHCAVSLGEPPLHQAARQTLTCSK